MLHLSITGSQRRGRAQSPCQEEAEEAEEEDCGLWSEQPENHKAWATEQGSQEGSCAENSRRQGACQVQRSSTSWDLPDKAGPSQ